MRSEGLQMESVLTHPGNKKSSFFYPQMGIQNNSDIKQRKIRLLGKLNLELLNIPLELYTISFNHLTDTKLQSLCASENNQNQSVSL